MSIENFKPFDAQEQSVMIGSGEGITIESGKDEIAIYGETTLDATETGMKKAQDLKEALKLIMAKLPEKETAQKMKAESANPLRASKKGATLTVWGDVTIKREAASAELFNKVIKQLEKFCEIPPSPSEAGPKIKR